MELPVRAYIGLGSNQDDPVLQLAGARLELAAIDDCKLVRCSSLYRSAPVGYTDQPDFINAVCRLDTTLAARALLDELHRIEAVHGRRRDGLRDRPRSLDLDLLLYGDQQIDEPGLVVPHPRMHQRAFVLYPLGEIAGADDVPETVPLDRWLDAVAGQRVERLADKTPWDS